MKPAWRSRTVLGLGTLGIMAGANTAWPAAQRLLLAALGYFAGDGDVALPPEQLAADIGTVAVWCLGFFGGLIGRFQAQGPLRLL